MEQTEASLKCRPQGTAPAFWAREDTEGDREWSMRGWRVVMLRDINKRIKQVSRHMVVGTYFIFRQVFWQVVLEALKVCMPSHLRIILPRICLKEVTMDMCKYIANGL